MKILEKSEMKAIQGGRVQCRRTGHSWNGYYEYKCCEPTRRDWECWYDYQSN